MIINNKEFISTTECLSRYSDSDIIDEAWDVYVFYKGFASKQVPATTREGMITTKIYIEGMIQPKDFCPIVEHKHLDIYESFNHCAECQTNEYLKVNGEYIDDVFDIILDRHIYTDPAHTEFYYEINELDKKAKKYGIKIFEPKDIDITDETELSNMPVTTFDNSTDIYQSNIRIQEKRELILKGWLAGKGLDIKNPLELTQETVWEHLCSVDTAVFRSASPDTIKQFFKNQNLCSFKVGRRKG